MEVQNESELGSHYLSSEGGVTDYSCVVANDDSFQLMAMVHNLQMQKINILKEAGNGYEAVEWIR